MKKFNVKYALLVLPLILFIPASHIFAAGSSQHSKTPFNWSLGLLNVQSGEMLDFAAPVQSAAGDKFRIAISPKAACFAYVIYESPSSDNMEVIYAGPIKKGQTWYSKILELTPPGGLESFKIIVSLEEQKILGKKIAELIQSPETSTLAIKNEIQRLEGEAAQVNEGPSTPSFLGGIIRGTPGTNVGVEYSGLGTYVKTIRIEH